MEKYLIVLDHEYRVPPFMISLLQYAERDFEKVYYINTNKPQNADLFSNSGINILFPSKISKIKSAIVAALRFFSFENIKQWWFCVRKEGFSLNYIRQLFCYLAADITTKTLARRIIREKGDDAKMIVLAAWFAAAALATSELKREFPQIKAVSLAHSYEILILRNKFIPYLYVSQKHKYLDGVFFIANKVRELYIEGIGGLKDAYFKKTHVCYLGSFKKNDVINVSNPNEFHICTCSRMVPLKRLDVLMDALATWDKGDIFCSYLGGGELEATLRQKAHDVMDNNPRVHIQFTGYLINEKVKEYYGQNPIDLFINLSSIEGLPISIMEAISYGLPVLATDVGGTNEIVNKGFGMLINSNISPEIVKQHIYDFMNFPEERRNQFRKNAYLHWKNNFDAERNMKVLFDIINTI